MLAADEQLDFSKETLQHRHRLLLPAQRADRPSGSVGASTPTHLRPTRLADVHGVPSSPSLLPPNLELLGAPSRPSPLLSVPPPPASHLFVPSHCLRSTSPASRRPSRVLPSLSLPFRQ